jgi:hypothetical protein
MTVPVGMVLVSHSPELALGLLALVRQFGDGTVPFVAAGGTDDGRLGVGSGGGVDPRRSPAIPGDLAAVVAAAEEARRTSKLG